MPNPVPILERIQKIDLEITAVEDEERLCLKEKEKAEALLKGLEEKKVSLIPEVERLKAAIKEAEERARAAKEKMERNEKRVSEVKNDRELKAVNKETHEAKKAARQAQEEINGLNAKFSSVSERFKEAEDGIASFSSDIERLDKEIEDKKGVWAEALRIKRNEREGASAGVSPEMLKRYETIREKRGGRAVVPVKGEACQGCFMHIPPQVYIILQKNTGEIISCPHCHRILYVEAQAEPEAV